METLNIQPRKRSPK